jgi:hypothetical protein
MKSHSVPSSRERFYVLDAKNEPVEVFDRAEWSRWMTENELIFRRTLLDESGVTVTTRFRGVPAPKTGDASLFVTRVAGMEARNNKSYEHVRSMRRWSTMSSSCRKSSGC